MKPTKGGKRDKSRRRTQSVTRDEVQGRPGLAIATKSKMVKNAVNKLKINKRPEARRSTWPPIMPLPKFKPLGGGTGSWLDYFGPENWDIVPDWWWDGPDKPSFFNPPSKPKPKPKPKKKKRKPLLFNEPARGTHPVHM